MNGSRGDSRKNSLVEAEEPKHGLTPVKHEVFNHSPKNLSPGNGHLRSSPNASPKASPRAEMEPADFGDSILDPDAQESLLLDDTPDGRSRHSSLISTQPGSSNLGLDSMPNSTRELLGSNSPMDHYDSGGRSRTSSLLVPSPDKVAVKRLSKAPVESFEPADDDEEVLAHLGNDESKVLAHLGNDESMQGLSQSRNGLQVSIKQRDSHPSAWNVIGAIEGAARDMMGLRGSNRQVTKPLPDLGPANVKPALLAQEDPNESDKIIIGQLLDRLDKSAARTSRKPKEKAMAPEISKPKKKREKVQNTALSPWVPNSPVFRGRTYFQDD